MPSQRPLSRNPFLDQPVAARPVDNLAAPAGPDKTQSLTAEDIFVRFHLSPSRSTTWSRVPNCSLSLSLSLLAVWSQRDQTVLTKVFISI
jgi:hypothetical protein